MLVWTLGVLLEPTDAVEKLRLLLLLRLLRSLVEDSMTFINLSTTVMRSSRTRDTSMSWCCHDEGHTGTVSVRGKPGGSVNASVACELAISGQLI